MRFLLIMKFVIFSEITYFHQILHLPHVLSIFTELKNAMKQNTVASPWPTVGIFFYITQLNRLLSVNS